MVLFFTLTTINLFPQIVIKEKIFDEEYILIESTKQNIIKNVYLTDITLLLKSSVNPINGNPISFETRNKLDNRKPFIVTINNHSKARPQHGLSEADFVMEVLAEGGITRYVAVYYENEPEKIGPVRSIRRYMLDFIAEFDDPVILHEGGASFNSSDPVYVRETDAIRDLVQYGMKSMQTIESRYRDPIKGAKSGYVHSLYTSYKLISDDFNRIARSRGWENKTELDELLWKIEADKEDRGNGGEINISFLNNSPYSNSKFIYNKETNSYDRIIAGKKDIDQNNQKQVSPKNIIVEWHKYRLANDGYSRIILDMVGEGEVQIYRDGKIVNGKWVKESREARTRYFDNEGNEIELVKGQIWKVVAAKYGNQKLSVVNYEKY